MKTAREAVHEAIRLADVDGACNLPRCALEEGRDHGIACQRLTAATEARDAEAEADAEESFRARYAEDTRHLRAQLAAAESLLRRYREALEACAELLKDARAPRRLDTVPTEVWRKWHDKREALGALVRAAIAAATSTPPATPLRPAGFREGTYEPAYDVSCHECGAPVGIGCDRADDKPCPSRVAGGAAPPAPPGPCGVCCGTKTALLGEGCGVDPCPKCQGSTP